MSISTESSNGGGITADPDAADTLCGQNDEIEPNNDKQFTAAQQEAAQTKLDQLEQNFGFDPEGVFYSLFRPLREKIKQIELEERNMEEYQNRQQQVIIDAFTKKLKGSIDQFSLMRSDQKKTVLDRLNANEREEKLKNFLGQFVGGQNKKFEEQEEETDRRTIQKQKKEHEKVNMPISTESINGGGDLTTDQEWWPPNFANLDPSEELRLLRARISQLERQQTINISQTSCASFDLLAQNENDAADTLYVQNDEIWPNNDKSMAEKLDQLEEKIKQIELELKGIKQLKGEQIAKMEEYQKQQVIIDAFTKKLKGSIDQFSLMRSDQKKTVLDRLNANEREEKLKNFLGQFVGGQNKKFEEQEEETDRRTLQKQKKEHEKEMNQLKWELVAKIELYYQKQQLLNIGLTLQNRWDSAACHDQLALIGPDRLIVQNNGKNWGFHSVFAELPMPKSNSGIFYYEVKVLALEGFVFIGLASKQMPLDKSVGDYNGTYSYGSTGRFWAHSVERYRFNGYDGDSDILGRPKFGVRRDIVGCGVNLATRQIIYTLNGERLERGHLYVDSDADELFPCVSLLGSGTKIVANFGPHFEYQLFSPTGQSHDEDTPTVDVFDDYELDDYELDLDF
ncbi:hypothetical protein GPALN_012028 [Globodera pallida]|nr:hypothetical protein GPALN_012028 [Globodera pallida]